MQGLVSEMQRSCPRCMAQGRLHLGNRPAPVHPGFYYFTIQYCTILLCTILLLTIPLFTILPRPHPFASRKPTCAGSPRILLFYYFLLFYHNPSRLHLGNRPAPVHPGFYYFAILLFYYFSTVLFYYVLFYC